MRMTKVIITIANLRMCVNHIVSKRFEWTNRTWSMTHPQALWWIHHKSKGGDNGRRRSWGVLPGS
jgi:hypothetical protein